MKRIQYTRTSFMEKKRLHPKLSASGKVDHRCTVSVRKTRVKPTLLKWAQK